MFTANQKQLLEVTSDKTPPKKENAFTKKGKKASVTTTALGNHAVKVTTTDNDFVDQFAKASAYKSPRSYLTVDKDMHLLWSQDRELTVKLSLYLRLVTRTVQVTEGYSTETTQRGQGLKNEGIMRMLWLAVNAEDTFFKNLPLFIAVGSWRDLIHMLAIDLKANGWKKRALPWDKIGKFILAALENPNSSELVKKYLPQIRSNKECSTLDAQADNIIGKWICYLLFGNKQNVKFDPTSVLNSGNGYTYKMYRKLKTSGTAHEWQKLIGRGKMLDIDFNTVHGRALSLLVSSKFLKSNNLEEKYSKWIESKPIAKYTGYVYELLAPVKIGYRNQTLKKYQEDTINKQFLGLIEVAKKGMKEGESGLLVVVDSSSSMTSMLPGTKVSAYSVAKAMALYFSYLLKGPFENHFMEFADNSKLIEWKGTTPVDKLRNNSCQAYGGTNFISVANEFCRLKQKGVPESDFPSGILALSDGMFNPILYGRQMKSNFSSFLATLRSNGFSKEYVDNFKIILWDIPNHFYKKDGSQAFEDFADTPNLFHVGGLDGSVVAFATGTTHQEKLPQTSEELFMAAMDQEVLNLVEV